MCEHRLRIRILWILKVPKIHEFLRILKLSILKFKLSHSSPPSSNKFFVANAALNFWIKSSVMSTQQDSLSSSTVQHDHEQRFTKSTNRLQLYCLPLCQNRSPRSSPSCSHSTNQRLPQCNRLLVLCACENFALTSDAIKWIFTNLKNFVKFANFLRILNTEVMNSQSMPVTLNWGLYY